MSGLKKVHENQPKNASIQPTLSKCTILHKDGHIDVYSDAGSSKEIRVAS
jgi:hypothetical protein